MNTDDRREVFNQWINGKDIQIYVAGKWVDIERPTRNEWMHYRLRVKPILVPAWKWVVFANGVCEKFLTTPGSTAMEITAYHATEKEANELWNDEKTYRILCKIPQTQIMKEES